jgi:hypothetical protein
MDILSEGEQTESQEIQPDRQAYGQLNDIMISFKHEEGLYLAARRLDYEAP